jgi:hypothetical protein
MLAACPSDGFVVFGDSFGSIPGVAIVERDGWFGDSFLTAVCPTELRGEADAFEALSEAPAE